MNKDMFGNEDTSVDRSDVPTRKEPRAIFRCNECGKKFTVSVFAADVQCPKCEGVDLDEL